MKIKINKKPTFENDSYFFTIKNFKFNINKIKDLYVLLKLEKFKNKDISKEGFENFLKERGSLRFFNSLSSLDGSIYTYSVEKRNNLTYENILKIVKETLNKNKFSRKVVVRMVNPLDEYIKSENGCFDTSCLNLIHYLDKKVVLVFRASDIKYELFADIITLYEFFIKPIYGDKKIDIEIFSSTGQNIKFLKKLIYNLRKF